MLTSKQLKLFGLFGKNIFKEYTYKEFKDFSKMKSNSLIQNAIKKFIKEELITERRIGTSKLYKINQNNDKVYDYLRIYNQDKIPKVVKNCILTLKKSIDKEEIFYAMVIFGSYANETNTNESDLDIAIFLKEKSKRTELAIHSASNRTVLEIDTHIISETEFLEMLKADYGNLGKQIAMKNLPIINPNLFYKLIIKAINNGFNPLSSKSRK